MKFFRGDPNVTKVARLKNIPVFHQLSRQEILEVDELLHERIYEPEEIIFEEGDPGHGTYIIVSGKVRANPSHELLKNTVLEFGPGDLVGELSLFDEAPRTATVVAVERTMMLALFQAEFAALLLKNKSIGVKVLVELARTLSRRARLLLQQQKHYPSL